MLVRFLLLVLLAFFLARAVWRLLEGVARGAAGTDSRSRRPKGPPQGVRMARCHVCGTYVVPEKSLSLVRAGHTVYVCSEQCRDAA